MADAEDHGSGCLIIGTGGGWRVHPRPVHPSHGNMLVWNVRKSLCESNPLHYKKYTASVLELARLDREVRPFFDPAWREEYAKSWVMGAPGYPDTVLDPGSSDAYRISRQARGSWFWAREYARNPEARHSDPPLVFSPAPEPTPTGFPSRDPDTGESGRKRRKKTDSVEKKGAVLRCVRIRIKPTDEQKRIFRTCMGVYRHVYNECVTAENNGLVHGTSNEEMVRWRSILTKRSNYVALKPWKDACPNHTKQQAVEHFFRAKRSAVTSSSGGRAFEMGYKSRYRSRKETFPLDRYKLWDDTEKKHEKNTFFSFIYKRRDMRMPVRGRLPACLRGRRDDKAVREEVKITRTRLGEWYAVISVEVCPSDRYENDTGGSMVSFDPGVKTFLTWHSTDGTWGEIGKFRPQEDLLARADSLRSSLDSAGQYRNARWRRRIHRRYLAILERVRRRTRDLHNKICSWATRRFRLILLPSFETSQLASSNRLHTRTCRKMLSWSHHAFKRRLVDAARKYGDVKVRICNESFTTKTCGSCGSIWGDMTLDDRMFRCGRCGMESTRDGNAARNVGLRALPFILE